jgi:hypothetical protein
MSVFTMLMLGTSPMGGMLAGVAAQVVGSVPLVVGASSGLCLLIVLASTIRAPVIRQL